jgi:hypothetical protein
MKWVPIAVALLTGGVAAAYWSVREPSVRLRRFCDEVRPDEQKAAVMARAKGAGLPFDEYFGPEHVVHIWVHAYPGRTICSLSIRGENVVRHDFFDD